MSVRVLCLVDAYLSASFYDTLAIYHGFIASPTGSLSSPSPLLLSAICTAASSRSSSVRRTAKNQTNSSSIWSQLFDKALLRLLNDTRDKTWDDVVGLCIAMTWYWKADGSTSGLIYGCYLATLTPHLADVRSRRVWDFLQVRCAHHLALC